MKVLAIIIISMMLFMGLAPGLASGQDDEIIFRIATQDDIRTTNPLTAGDVWTWNVLDWIYEPATLIDDTENELVPYIAIGSASKSTNTGQIDWDDCTIGNFGYSPEETWNNSNIRETTIFYDFTDVYWHDGEQMDIRDIMFSFHVTAQVPEWSSSMNCLKDNGGRTGSNYSETSWLHIYKAWESPDGLQAALKFQLQEPFAGFFIYTLSCKLLPYHIWGYTESGQKADGAYIWYDEDYDIDANETWRIDLAQSFDNENPVGSGIFKWDYWQQGQLVKITTWRDHFFNDDYAYKDFINDNYPDTTVKQPYIDAMVFQNLQDC